jgi:CheY-like chemotaxis protein
MTEEHTIDKINGSTDHSSIRILVVDDSSTIRRSAESMLTAEGYDVVTAENGFEALSMVARHNPDLIFVDIMMPRLDGYQTCAIIKRVIRPGSRTRCRVRSVPHQAFHQRGVASSGSTARGCLIQAQNNGPLNKDSEGTDESER